VGGVGSHGGLYVGAGSTLDTASFFSGLIDGVRIYNRAGFVMPSRNQDHGSAFPCVALLSSVSGRFLVPAERGPDLVFLGFGLGSYTFYW